MKRKYNYNVAESNVNYRIGKSFFGDKEDEFKKRKYSYFSGFRRLLK